MRNNVFPTKGNLLSTKKSLALAKMGFELLDRKRNILVPVSYTHLSIPNSNFSVTPLT